MADIEKLVGSESRLEVGQKINDIIDNSANVSLSNLDATGEARFSDILSEVSSNTTKISNLTTTVNDKLSASVKKASNGYIKFSNGIIIQWGRVSIDATSNSTITLPTAFTSTNYKVTATIYSTTATSQKNVSVYNYTTTSFIMYNGQGGTMSYDWIAIGY